MKTKLLILIAILFFSCEVLEPEPPRLPAKSAMKIYMIGYKQGINAQLTKELYGQSTDLSFTKDSLEIHNIIYNTK